MPVLPDVGPLGSLAGWGVAVVLVSGMLWRFYGAIKSGDLVPGHTHKRVLDKLDERDKLLADLSSSTQTLAKFVSDRLRDG
jgi:hypothetical protein